MFFLRRSSDALRAALAALAAPLAALAAPLAAPPLDLPSALRALGHPQGTLDALRHLLTLPPEALEGARSEALYAALDRVTLDTAQPLTARAWAVEALKRLGQGRGATRALLTGEGVEPALAREAAGALRALARVDLLAGATRHPDPEVRAHAAAAGADPEGLCALLSDPWPAVRYGAIVGLERLAAPASICLAAALRDPEPAHQERAARALGALSAAPWAARREESAGLRALGAGLLALAADTRSPPEARGAALVAVARWGSTEPAERVLKAHVEKGGLLTLSACAAQAIAVAAPLSPAERAARLSRLLVEGRAPEVRLAAARHLGALGAEGAERVRAWAARVGGDEGRAALARLPASAREGSGEGEGAGEGAPQELAPSLDEEDRLGL